MAGKNDKKWGLNWGAAAPDFEEGAKQQAEEFVRRNFADNTDNADGEEEDVPVGAGVLRKEEKPVVESWENQKLPAQEWGNKAVEDVKRRGEEVEPEAERQAAENLQRPVWERGGRKLNLNEQPVAAADAVAVRASVPVQPVENKYPVDSNTDKLAGDVARAGIKQMDDYISQTLARNEGMSEGERMVAARRGEQDVYLTPYKASMEYVPSKIVDDITNNLATPIAISHIRENAESRRMPVEQYIEKVLLPAVNSKVTEELVRRKMPKNIIDAALSPLRASIIGKVMQGVAGVPYEARAVEQQAQAQYDEMLKEEIAKGGAAEKVAAGTLLLGRMAAPYVADAAPFKVLGVVSNAAGLGRLANASMLSGNGFLSTAVRAGLREGGAFGAYEGVSGLLDDAVNDEVTWLQAAENFGLNYLKGTVKGVGLGAIRAGMGRAYEGMTGDSRGFFGSGQTALRAAASYTAETGWLATADVLEKYAEDPTHFNLNTVDWKNELINSGLTVMMMKLSAAMHRAPKNTEADKIQLTETDKAAFRNAGIPIVRDGDAQKWVFQNAELYAGIPKEKQLWWRRATEIVDNKALSVEQKNVLLKKAGLTGGIPELPTYRVDEVKPYIVSDGKGARTVLYRVDEFDGQGTLQRRRVFNTEREAQKYQAGVKATETDNKLAFWQDKSGTIKTSAATVEAIGTMVENGADVETLKKILNKILNKKAEELTYQEKAVKEQFDAIFNESKEGQRTFYEDAAEDVAEKFGLEPQDVETLVEMQGENHSEKGAQVVDEFIQALEEWARPKEGEGWRTSEKGWDVAMQEMASATIPEGELQQLKAEGKRLYQEGDSKAMHEQTQRFKAAENRVTYIDENGERQFARYGDKPLWDNYLRQKAIYDAMLEEHNAQHSEAYKEAEAFVKDELMADQEGNVRVVRVGDKPYVVLNADMDVMIVAPVDVAEDGSLNFASVDRGRALSMMRSSAGEMEVHGVDEVMRSMHPEVVAERDGIFGDTKPEVGQVIETVADEQGNLMREAVTGTDGKGQWVLTREDGTQRAVTEPELTQMIREQEQRVDDERYFKEEVEAIRAKDQEQRLAEAKRKQEEAVKKGEAVAEKKPVVAENIPVPRDQEGNADLNGMAEAGTSVANAIEALTEAFDGDTGRAQRVVAAKVKALMKQGEAEPEVVDDADGDLNAMAAKARERSAARAKLGREQNYWLNLLSEMTGRRPEVLAKGIDEPNNYRQPKEVMGEQLDKLAQALGVKVEKTYNMYEIMMADESITDKPKTVAEGNEYNGYRKNDGTIVVNMNSEHAMAWTMGHETGHHIEKTSPQLYERLKAAILDTIDPRYIAWKLERLKADKTYRSKSESELLTEVANDGLGRVFADETQFKELLQKLGVEEQNALLKYMKPLVGQVRKAAKVLRETWGTLTGKAQEANQSLLDAEKSERLLSLAEAAYGDAIQEQAKEQPAAKGGVENSKEYSELSDEEMLNAYHAKAAERREKAVNEINKGIEAGQWGTWKDMKRGAININVMSGLEWGLNNATLHGRRPHVVISDTSDGGRRKVNTSEEFKEQTVLHLEALEDLKREYMDMHFSPVLTDAARRVADSNVYAIGYAQKYYEMALKGDPDVMKMEAPEFSKETTREEEEQRPIWLSNADVAVRNIKQDKATAEQWRAMIEKAGGLKAGEDKWMGLSAWLDSKKGEKLTKDEVLDYIRENTIQVEDVTYQEINEDDVELMPKMREYADEFRKRVRETGNEDEAFDQMVSEYGDDFGTAFGYGDGELYPEWEYGTETINDAARHYLSIDENPINETRLGFTTKGLDNKKEIALVVPTIEPYHSNDKVHFGDAGDGRAVAWVRFGETTISANDKDLREKDAEALNALNEYTSKKARKYQSLMKPLQQVMTDEERAEYKRLGDAVLEADKALKEAQETETKRVIVIDEIQSKSHQDRREKGTRTPEGQAKINRWNELSYRNVFGQLTPEESAELAGLKQEGVNNSYGGVPDAPFDKNWHELAMKRMIRYAAENGYDKLAWTKGEQQAERYNIGKVIDQIGRSQMFGDTGEIRYDLFPKDDSGSISLFVKDGVVTRSAREEFEEKRLEEVVGKDLAAKMLEMPDHSSLNISEMPIGGEGMRGFYDQILPRFMDKYGKKWGVKTGEIELPNLEESAQKMWAVDITPEMKESVMGGQPLFSKEGRRQKDNDAQLDLFRDYKPDTQRIKDMTDKQLLDMIGEGVRSEWDFYQDEYDKRHNKEYGEELDSYTNILEKAEMSLDDAYGMYGSIMRRYNAGGYASVARTKLRAQADALAEYIYQKEAEEDGGVSFSKEERPEVLDALEKGKTIKVYRAIRVASDGTLNSPMAGGGVEGSRKAERVGVYTPELGVWEKADEHPELAIFNEGDEYGHIVIDKGEGDGTLEVAYNPYIHTSRQMLNDQFSSAWKCPGLQVMEVEVPVSELTSGYRADRAKNAVGESEWKEGPVSRLLPEDKKRSVILSRWDKPVRIVPVEEYAKAVKAQLEGTDIEGVPFNTVTPEQREALVKEGVKILEPETNNAGKASMKAYEEWKQRSGEVQGLDGYTVGDVLDYVRGEIETLLDEADIDVKIKGMALNGSRMRGDARGDSDLDVVVEYAGRICEDGLFNILNEEPIEIEGIKVDINPITKGKSGTLEQYMERSRKYDEEQGAAKFSKEIADFDERRRKAVKENGVVTANLKELKFNVLDVQRHDFKGTALEALHSAEQWAKTHIKGTYYATSGDGKKFAYTIGNKSIEKYVSKSSTGKSENLGVHLSVLKVLPEVISGSAEVEVHPDYIKSETGGRSRNSSINEQSLMHRFYGAVRIDGNVYRVKTTIREYADKNRGARAHNYEVTKIELVEVPFTGDTNVSGEHSAMTSANSILGAKLLENIEKSYDLGKKLLDESKNSQIRTENNGDYSSENADIHFSKETPAPKEGEDWKDYAGRVSRWMKYRKEGLFDSQIEDLESIRTAIAETDTDPSEAEKKSGNYKMGHAHLDGYQITIENPAGSVRRGTDPDGKAWETKMHYTYGYIRGTRGKDGDHIDIFLSENPAKGNVYVVDQVDPKTGKFDEHKVMYGFGSKEEAREAYLSNYEDGWKGLGDITGVSKEAFRKWVDSSTRKTKPFKEYAGVEKIEEPAFSKEDEKTLMGVHNISEENLRKAIRLGGLANPSMAVIDTNNGMHSDYGEISLIPRSSLIDSRTGRNAGTYAGDAWTATYPHVEKFLTKQGDKHRLAIAKEAANGDKELEDHLREGLWNYVNGADNRLHLLFLLQKGLKPEIIGERTTHTHEEYENMVKMFGEEFWNISTKDITREQSDAIVEILMHDTYAYAKIAAEKIKDPEKREKAYNALVDMRRDELVDENGKIYLAPFNRYLYDVYRDEQRRVNPKPDWYRTDNEADYRIAKEGLSEEYEEWKNNLFTDGDVEEKLFAGYTPSGNRRYVPNTLENASKLMNRYSGSNAYDQTGFGASRAMLLKKMRTLAEIRKQKGKLKGVNEETEQRYQDASDEMFGVVKMLSDMQKISDNPFSNNDYVNARLNEALGTKDPIDHLNREYGYNISRDGEFATALKDMLQTIENLPVKYFETKFKRPVTLDEFAVAVVPDGTDANVVEALKNAGLDVRTYDGTEEGRKAVSLEAVKGRGDILFSKESKAADIESAGAVIDHMADMGINVFSDIFGNRKALKLAEADKSENGKVRKMKTSDGKTYGFAYRGDIYLDPRNIDPSKPLHEYSHLWCEALRKANPENWNSVVDVIKRDEDAWKFIKGNYKELTEDGDIAEEVIATYSGDKGAERLKAELQRMSKRDDAYKSRWGNIFKNVSKAIQDFWKKVGDFLNIKYETPEQVYNQILKDFADGVNPRKKVEAYLKERDVEYKEAVDNGDAEKAKEIFDEVLREEVGNNMTPYIAVGKYRNVSGLAHKVKTREPEVIAKVADMMEPLIPKDAVLVPVPSHTGEATDMLDLANAIAERTGAPVADVLKSEPRGSQFDAKKAGGALTAEELGITMKGELPEGKLPVLIDNVVDSGNTAEACVKALGRGVVVSLGDSVEKYHHAVTLKSAAPITYDDKGEVIPLSERFNLGKRDVRFSKEENDFAERYSGGDEEKKAQIAGRISKINTIREKFGKESLLSDEDLLSLHEELKKPIHRFYEATAENIANEYINEIYGSDKNVIDPDELRARAFGIVGYDGTNVSLYGKNDNLIAKVYQKALAKAIADNNPTVILLTGHAGAGKSTALRTSGIDTSGMGVVYDSAFNTYNSLARAIDTAKEAGIKESDIRVVAVYNDPVTSFSNTLARAKKEGRTVPFNYFFGHAFVSNEGKLRDLSDNFPEVKIVCLDNSGNNSRGEVSLEEAKSWSYEVSEQQFKEALKLVEDEINRKDGGLTEHQITSIARGLSGTEEMPKELDGVAKRIEVRLSGNGRRGSVGEVGRELTPAVSNEVPAPREGEGALEYAQRVMAWQREKGKGEEPQFSKEDEKVKKGKSAAWKQAYDKAEGKQYLRDILLDLEPHTIEEVAAETLKGGGLLWDDVKDSDGKVLIKGVKSHMGYKEGERRKFMGLFLTQEKGGVGFEKKGEAVEVECQRLGIAYDENDPTAGVNAMQEVLGRCETKKDLNEYLQEQRVRDVEAARKSEEEAELAVLDEEYMAKYGVDKLTYDAIMDELSGEKERAKTSRQLDILQQKIERQSETMNQMWTELKQARLDSEGKKIAGELSRQLLESESKNKELLAELAEKRNTGKKLDNTRIAMERREAVRKQLIDYIREQMAAEWMPYTTKQDLGRLLTAVQQATTPEALEKAMRSVQHVSMSGMVRAQQQRLDRLMALKVQDVNGKNMSIAKNVDDRTRVILQGVRQRVMDNKMVNLLEQLDDLRRDRIWLNAGLRKMRQRGEAPEVIAEEEAKLQRNAERMANLEQQIEDIREQKPGTQESDIQREIAELNKKADNAATGEVVWTTEDTDMMTQLQLMQALVEPREYTVQEAEIGRELSQKIDNVKELVAQRNAATDGAVRHDLTDKIKAERAKIDGLQDARSEAQKARSEALSRVIELFQGVINGGKESLQAKVQAEAEKRMMLIREAVRSVSGGKGVSDGQSREGQDKQKDNTKQGVVTMAISAPLGSFDYMCQKIDTEGGQGKDGWIYRRFVSGEEGAMEANNTYLTGVEEQMDVLNKKVGEVFGTKRGFLGTDAWVMQAAKADEIVKNCGVTRRDDKVIGGRASESLSKGQATYIWAVWQMPDGRMKLKQQGYDEESIEEIETFIGPKYIELAKWLSSEFFANARAKYNERYREMYNTSMARIENYVPLRTNEMERHNESGLEDPSKVGQSVEVRVGSLINRKFNTVPVDITNSIFDIVSDHVETMENWYAYARIRRDLDAILSNNYFRNQVNANAAGDLERLYRAAEVATRSYKPETEKLGALTNFLNKGLIAGNIAYRLNTALKQLLSAPAYLGYSYDPRYLITLGKNTMTGALGLNLKWCYENIPSFRKRVDVGDLGDNRWSEQTNEKITQWLQKYASVGMLPNRLIDALTCSIGVKSIYDYNFAKITKGLADRNLTREERAKLVQEAERRAKMEADIYYNQTQQSSHPVFLSPMQMDQTTVARVLTVYRNANLGYTRKMIEHAWDLWRHTDYDKFISAYKRMYLQSGMSKEEAEHEAKMKYWKSLGDDAWGLALYGYGMKLLWNAGSKGLLGFLQDDDDDKKKAGESEEQFQKRRKWEKANEIATWMFTPLQGTPLGDALLETAAGATVGSGGRSLSTTLFVDAMADMLREVKAADLDPMLTTAILGKYAAKVGGIDFQTWGNIYIGVEGLVKDGYPYDDKLIDIMYILNTPRSGRKEAARTLFKKYRPNATEEEFQKVVAYADGFMTRNSLAGEYMPGMKEAAGDKYAREYKQLSQEYQGKPTEEGKQEGFGELYRKSVVYDDLKEDADVSNLHGQLIQAEKKRDEQFRQSKKVYGEDYAKNEKEIWEIKHSYELDLRVVYDDYKRKGKKLSAMLTGDREQDVETMAKIRALRRKFLQLTKDSDKLSDVAWEINYYKKNDIEKDVWQE